MTVDYIKHIYIFLLAEGPKRSGPPSTKDMRNVQRKRLVALNYIKDSDVLELIGKYMLPGNMLYAEYIKIEQRRIWSKVNYPRGTVF